MSALRFSISVLLLLVCITGCTKRKDESLSLNIHFPKVNLILDPHKMEDAYSMMVVTQLFRGLLRFNAAGDVVPDLAISWSESTDRTTYDFKLGNNTFSNGERITAQDVQMSFARIFILGAGMAADLDYISGTQKFLKSKNISDLGIIVISDDTVRFDLDHPSALFLKHIAVADCAVMPFRNIETLAHTPSAYSGPYKVARQTETEVTLSKWRQDRLESSHPPQTIKFFTTDEPGLVLAKKGSTDSLDTEPVTDSELKVLRETGWSPSTTELTAEAFIILNPQVLSIELREYLFDQVDSQKIAEIVGDPRLKPAYGLIPTNFPGELSLLESKPLKSGAITYNGRKTSFTLDYSPSSTFEVTVVNYLKSVWTSDKVTIHFNPVGLGEKLQKMFKKKSDAVIGRKFADYPDGFSVLTYFKGKYDSNYFHVDDPEVDAAINHSVGEFDQNKRAELYKKIEELILKKYTYIPLAFGSRSSGLWSGKIKSVPSHPMGAHTMPFETIEMRAQ